jgi:signal transduction histidine kinase
MVDAVLTLARLDAKSFALAEMPPLRLDQLIEVLVKDANTVAAQRGLQVVVEVPAIEVRADADAIAIALRNLIDNALRHARSRVTVQASLSHARVTVIVADDGPGFAAAAATRAFDRFHRGDSGGAAGLGLAMVRRVAELHGGVARLLPGSGGARIALEWPA